MKTIEKQLRDHRKLIFIVLIVLVAAVTAFNIYLNMNIHHKGKVHQLKNENQALKEENQSLKKAIQQTTPSAQEKQRRAYMSVVEHFIQVAYVQKKDGYEKRMNEARQLMTDDLLKRFYPSSAFQGDGRFTTTPKDITVYLSTHEPFAKKIEAIVTFTQSIQYHDKKDTEDTRSVLQVTVEKKHDQWIVTGLKEISLKRL